MKRQSDLVKVKMVKNQRILADQCVLASSLFLRARGLMGTREFIFGQGMLLIPCNSIHMWFMSVPIDCVFLKKIDKETFEVTQVFENLKPWKLIPVGSRRADATLELPAGIAKLNSVLLGDILCIN